MYRASYCNVLMTNEMHNSYKQFYSTVFCLLYIFGMNLVVHHQDHGLIYCITQFGTIGIIVQASLAAFKAERFACTIAHVQQTKNCGIKIDYR